MSVLRDPLPDAKEVVVFGLGWTGVAAANLLCRFGKRVRATDTRDRATLDTALEALRSKQGLALDPSVEVMVGGHAHHGANAVVLTQSVKHWEAPVADAREAGIPVIPEIELGERTLRGGPIEMIAIGGTDGKTTTTKLCGHLAEALGRVWIGGNSWTPLSARLLEIEAELADKVLAPKEQAFLVTEVSAFQLPAWHDFHPRVGAVTNVAEDHVDEYFRGSLAAYVAAKYATVERLGLGDVAVINCDDQVVGSWLAPLAERSALSVGTSLTSRAVDGLPNAAFRSNGELRLRWGGRERAFMSSADMRLVGDHNVENLLTAAGALLPFGIAEVGDLRERVLAFEPPPHRVQHVIRAGGIDVYDDSKATNVHAALAGLAAFGARPVVAIVGGVDKGLDLGPLLESLRTRTRQTIVIGELRERFGTEARAAGFECVEAESLDNAVGLAFAAAQPGDAIVLSPACSSFDMFASYADRGRRFQALVRKRLDG